MNKKEYFTFLKKNLPKDKYKERFLEELEEHFEDALYLEAFQKEGSESRVLARLGAPEQTVFYYKRFMTKHSAFYTYLESLFWGILSTPLYLSLFVGNSVTESTEVLFLKVVLWFLTASVLGGAFYLFYRFVFSKLRPLNELLSPQGKIGSFFLNLIPAWLSVSLFTTSFYMGDNDEAQDYLFPLVLLAYVVVVGFFAWKAYAHSFKKSWIIHEAKLMYFFTLALFVVLLFTEVGEVVLYFSKVIWVILFYGFSGQLTQAVWTSGLLVLALGLFSLYGVVRWFGERSKPFPLFKTCLLATVIYALFLPRLGSEAYEAVDLNWNKPAVEFVSLLEKEEMGPFYLWSKKFRRDDGPNIQYSISYRGAGFFIHMQDLADYQLVPTSVDALGFESLDTDPTEVYPQTNSILHEDLRCELTEMAAQSYEGLEPPTLGGETDCKALYFKDELIFSREDEGWFILKNAVFSPDQTWMLLEFQDVMEDPTLLYLVDLR